MQGPVAGMPRIVGAIALAIAMHAAVLVLRPGVSGGRVSTPAASAMTVRVLHAPAAVATPPSLETAPMSPAPVTASERIEPTAPPPKAQVSADAATSERKWQKAEPVPPARSMPAEISADPSQRALAAAPEYALGIRLDPGPRPLDDIDPDYPDPVNLRTGSVVLRLLISETGHVDDVSVVRAEPTGVFDQAAVDAFSKARFSPGMAGGVPVKSQIRIEVQFMPINRGARISGRTY